MNHIRPVFLAACMLVLLPLSAGTVRAQYPSYLILQAPAARHAPHQPTYGYYPGVGYGVSTDAYAYGWFGVRPRRHHTSIHFGYYRNYTQWTFR